MSLEASIRQVRPDRKPTGLQMAMNVIKLDKIIDGLGMQNDEIDAYLDRDTGEVEMIHDEIRSLSKSDERDEWPDWQRELIVVFREIEKGAERYVQLPSQRDVHEWDIMRRFCETVNDERKREMLLRAIHGRGAFRHFKDELSRSALLDGWFKFERDALREHAIEWCEDNDIAFE